MNKNKILQDYIVNTTLHGKYTISGDHKKANTTYRKIVKVVKSLYKIDPEFNSLESLLGYGDDSVKIFAATELLFTKKNNIAAEVLEKIAKESGIFAFTASMVLSEWKKGNLKPLHEL